MSILRRQRETDPATCPESHRTFGPLAELIAAQIEERSARVLDSVDDTVTAVIRDLTQEKVDQRVRDVFDGLSPTAQWEILAAAFDDDSLRRVLRERHQRAAMAADPNKWIDLLIHDARKTRRVPVTSLPAGARMVLYLYDPERLVECPNDADLLNLEPDRRLELESAGGPQFQVWEDRIGRSWDGRYPLRTTTSIRLGSGPEGYSKMTANDLLFRRPVQYVESGTVRTFFVSNKRRSYVYLGLGRLTINGREIFSDPPSQPEV